MNKNGKPEYGLSRIRHVFRAWRTVSIPIKDIFGGNWNDPKITEGASAVGLHVGNSNEVQEKRDE